VRVLLTTSCLFLAACGARRTYVPQPLGDSGWKAPGGGSGDDTGSTP